MRRALIPVLILALFIPVPVFGAVSFSDMEGHAHATAVNMLSELGIVNGFPDGTFRPDEPVTREQFAVMLVNALGRQQTAKALNMHRTPFDDDDAISSWARGSVVMASSTGIIKGYPDGTFGPSRPVSGVEALTMILRALNLNPDKVGSWPVGTVLLADETGLTEGLELMLTIPATRAEIARMLSNALEIDYHFDEKTGALVKGDGSKSLLVKVWKRSAVDFLAEGKLDAISRSRKTVQISGKTFTWDQETKGFLNGVAMDLDQLSRVAEKGDLVRYDHRGDKLSRIEIIQSTWGWVQASTVELEKDETRYGHVVLRGVDYEIGDTEHTGDLVVKVDPDTIVILNGKEASWKDVKDAVDDFHRRYKDKPFLVGVAIAKHDRDADLVSGKAVLKASAYWIYVVTDNIIQGRVEAIGTDRDGAYLRIDGDKVYYKGFPAPQRSTVTLLADPDGIARVLLSGGGSTVQADELFWAVVRDFERDSRDGLVHLTLLSLNGEEDVKLATDWRGRSEVEEPFGAVGYPDIVAVRMDGDGYVTHLGRAASFDNNHEAFKQGTLSLAVTAPDPAGSVKRLSSRLWSLSLAGGNTGYIEDSVVLVEANGKPSNLRLESLRVEDIDKVFVLVEGNFYLVQVIQLKP